MIASDAFEYVVRLPDEALDIECEALLGFDSRYERIEKELHLLSDPDSLLKWAKAKYKGTIPPIFQLVGSRYPLFVLEGDVGTGKTVFARCAANRLCMHNRREGHLYALSTRVRGRGAVGEASSRINDAFQRITEDLGKNKHAFLLIDEADSLLTARSEQHSHLEDRVAVNTIIQKVDDLRRHGGRLVVFLATNRVSTLDPAVLRRVAVTETFKRPNEAERKELLLRDLYGLGISEEAIEHAVAATGSANGSPAFTYSDLRTKLLPRIVSLAFPDRIIIAQDVSDAVATVSPSPSVK